MGRWWKYGSGALLLGGSSLFAYKYHFDPTFERGVKLWTVGGPVVLRYRLLEQRMKYFPPASAEEREAAWTRLDLKYSGRLLDFIRQQKGMYVKYGQIGAGLTNTFSAIWIEKLRTLEDQCPARPISSVIDSIAAAYDAPASSIFSFIDSVPLGSASIGQVHRATLRDGRQVAVKIQDPESARLLREDMQTIGRFIKVFAREQMVVLGELERSLEREFDYVHEAANLREVAQNMKAAGLERVNGVRVVVPRPYESLTRSCVLVMEYLQGKKLRDGVDLYLAKEAAQKGITLEQLKKEYERKVEEEGVDARYGGPSATTIALYTRTVGALYSAQRGVARVVNRVVLDPLNWAALSCGFGGADAVGEVSDSGAVGGGCCGSAGRDAPGDLRRGNGCDLRAIDLELYDRVGTAALRCCRGTRRLAPLGSADVVVDAQTSVGSAGESSTCVDCSGCRCCILAARSASWRRRAPLPYIPLLRFVPPVNSPLVMDVLMRVHGQQLLGDGVFNADPHAGNFMLLDRYEVGAAEGSEGLGGSFVSRPPCTREWEAESLGEEVHTAGGVGELAIGLIDFGATKRLADEERLIACVIYAALWKGDKDKILELCRGTGLKTRNFDADVIYDMTRFGYDTYGKDLLKGRNVQQFIDECYAKDPWYEVPDNLVMAQFLSIRLRAVGLQMGCPVVCSDHWGPLAMSLLEHAGRPYHTWTAESVVSSHVSIAKG